MVFGKFERADTSSQYFKKKFKWRRWKRVKKNYPEDGGRVDCEIFSVRKGEVLVRL